MKWHSLACAILVMALLVDVTKPVDGRSLHRITFLDMGCKGTYDPYNFARVDNVCYECFNLYRNPAIIESCRSACYSNVTFLLCIDALMLHFEKEKLVGMVNLLQGMG